MNVIRFYDIENTENEFMNNTIISGGTRSTRCYAIPAMAGITQKNEL